jgi:hypothetical protein
LRFVVAGVVGPAGALRLCFWVGWFLPVGKQTEKPGASGVDQPIDFKFGSLALEPANTAFEISEFLGRARNLGRGCSLACAPGQCSPFLVWSPSLPFFAPTGNFLVQILTSTSKLCAPLGALRIPCSVVCGA